ncbi:MAG: LysM peptidoglycan-binding domain-containing protein [Paracoccaceae bacterium]
MAGWSGLGSGARAGIIAGAGLVAAGWAYVLWLAPVPDVPLVEAPAEVAAVAVPDTATTPAAIEETVAADVAPAVQAVAPVPDIVPEIVIDTWRVAADGAAAIVGRAAADARVVVLDAAGPVAEGVANGQGEFALLFTLPPNPAPSLLTVEAAGPGAAQVVRTTIALGPIAGPVVAVVPEVDVAEAPASEGETVVAATVAEADAAAPPAAILLTDAGAVVLHDTAPDTGPDTGPDVGPVAAVSIDAITYTGAGAVQLGGRAQPGAFVRLYLDDAPVQTVLVPEGGRWLTTLGDTAPGLYTLRADQLDDAGTVTSRFETPFKRETLESLAAVAAPQPEPEPQTELAATVIPEAVAVPAPGPVAEVVPEPQAVVVAVPEPETSVEPAVVSVADPDLAVAPATEPAADVATAPEPAPVAVAEVVPLGQPAPQPDLQPAPAPGPVTVTVLPGYTLWGIAQGQLGDGVMFVQVYEANKNRIRDPDLIYPGQVFTIPMAQ